jgi:hypothetical protein
MPDKRDMHQAKSHRSTKNQHHQARGQASMPAGSAKTLSTDDTQALPAVGRPAAGKKNTGKR